jgi:hypothetical protein
VIGLASAFRRQVIAEGVETVAHGTLLLQLGCELAQGYGIARPMPAEAFPAWALAWRTDPDWVNLPAVERADLPLLFASAEHRAWILALEAMLKDERSNPPPLNAHECRFGRWLDHEGLARYGELAQFEPIMPLHIEIHALAEVMCVLHDQGQTALALLKLPELHTRRDALLTHLKLLLSEKQGA